MGHPLFMIIWHHIRRPFPTPKLAKWERPHIKAESWMLVKGLCALTIEEPLPSWADLIGRTQGQSLQRTWELSGKHIEDFSGIRHEIRSE
jgi:hypothetical protein